jgi:putative acetyltransferase
MEITIRPEHKADFSAIRQIHLAAFETDAEANLVEALRESNVEIISLVAEHNESLIAHILFSRVELANNNPSVSIAGLAPMAVIPQYQRKGIGSQLVAAGIEACRAAGYSAIVVLGHPDFYPRFGFVPTVNYRIKSEYDVPENVFMIKELQEGALANCHGIIKYHKAFAQF